MPERIVAIHQPNFFPWGGYFDKIRRAQRFIFLDDAQYTKTGGSWSNRVRILRGKDGAWLTAPIDRNYHGLRTVSEMRFAPTAWREDIVRALEGAYRKAPCYAEAMALLQPLIAYEDNSIAAYNTHAIHSLAACFGLDTPCMASSGLGVDSAATERLIALVKAVGGDAYLCGGGAEGYQQDEAFADAGITLLYQHYIPSPYPQQGEAFVAGLSVMDALMHLGVASTAAWIRGEA